MSSNQFVKFRCDKDVTDTLNLHKCKNGGFFVIMNIDRQTVSISVRKGYSPYTNLSDSISGHKFFS